MRAMAHPKLYYVSLSYYWPPLIVGSIECKRRETWILYFAINRSKETWILSLITTCSNETNKKSQREIYDIKSGLCPSQGRIFTKELEQRSNSAIRGV